MRKLKDLPTEIDLEEELNELRSINLLKDKIELDKTVHITKAVFDKKRSIEYQLLLDKDEVVENKIKKKLTPILNKYLERKNWEGAKWFVGNSYKELNTCGKTLLFRKILVIQDQSK